MRSFSLDRVEGRVAERSAEREASEVAAAEEQVFNDATEALFRAFPEMSEYFEYFSSLSQEIEYLDREGIVDARAAVRSRLRVAAESYGEILGGLGHVSRLQKEFASSERGSGVDTAREYFRETYRAQGLLDSPELQSDFEEQWDCIYAARDFIEEAAAELKRLEVDATRRFRSSPPDAPYF